MGETFRPWDVDQGRLFPPAPKDLLPARHLAHFIREVVREELDLSAIYARYEESRGYPPYHPGMMTALLLYGYCRGIYSSRRLEQACEERVDFMVLTGMEKPDHSTICQFRTDHRTALSALFVQVLALCRDAGMVKLGHVALDGTKVKANASKHAAMSYKRMAEAEPELAKLVSDRKPTLRRWRSGASTSTSPPAGRSTGARAPRMTLQRSRAHGPRRCGRSSGPGASRAVPTSEAGGGTRVRPDQAGPRIPAVPPPGAPKGGDRRVPAVQHPQSAQTLRRARGHAGQGLIPDRPRRLETAPTATGSTFAILDSPRQSPPDRVVSRVEGSRLLC